MRATEKTFYNMKRLHAVFALSAIGLLVVTVWMLVADHRREWKRYQRTFRDRIEPWMTEVQIRTQQDRQSDARERELETALEKARSAVPDKTLIDEFRREVEKDAARRDVKPADFTDLQTAYEALAAEPSIAGRDALLAKSGRFVAAAVLRQENADRRLRFRRAEFDEARSYYEAAVGDGLPPQKLDKLQQKVDDIHGDVDRLAAELEDAAGHRLALQRILADLTREEDGLRKELADRRAELDRLRRALGQQRPSLGKRVLRGPLVDALGRPLAIEQIWLPELTIDYNFRPVARFDRCTTCHQGIARTQPGDPARPAFDSWQVFNVELATPAKAPETQENDKGQRAPPTLESVYGLVLTKRGILEDEAVTVGQVRPRTPAADARLRTGDVIAKVGDKPISDRAVAEKYLLEEVEWGRPLGLEIHRGLPNPYCSHPRPNLFVGSLSPHPMAEFGCTICHDGQGSATEFKFASHTPNAPDQRTRWRKEHGWFHNPNWGFPMMPGRFAENRCLKCHHAVTDLEPRPGNRQPPAPKLLSGYHLIRQHGCFGCHEIRGFDESGRSIGPDMRLEPSYAEAALQLLAGRRLNDRQQTLAQQVVDRPENAGPRRELVESILAEGGVSSLEVEQPALVELLDTEGSHPGTIRKVGPTLRNVRDKVTEEFLLDWIADPTNFLPSTRMPHLYGMHRYLDGRALEQAKRFDTVEIRAVVEYLLAAGQSVEPLPVPAEVTEPPDAVRGKTLFEIHGCLACHKHTDFPKGQAAQSPDLTNVGAKYATEAGRRWLVSWIRDPHRHSPRTLMPNPLLEPTAMAPPEGQGSGTADAEGDAPEAAADQTGRSRMTDPAADIAAYLMGGKAWKAKKLPPLDPADLDRYIEEAIPETTADGAQDGLARPPGKMTIRQKLHYAGHHAIRRRGCYGCHDIPGFENAQPIGPALTDWGRKQESLLAFEQINRFVEKSDDSKPSFFTEALLSHRREGFIWQKLRGPRSFDYKKAQNKAYHEWLTMGRFELTDRQREAIITFVLGLVAEPPHQRYVYRPDPRQEAIVEGRKVLDKYACAECHTMEMERWSFEFVPERFEDPRPMEDYDFLQPRFSSEQIKASARPDDRGLGVAEVVGMRQVDGRGNLIESDDDEDDRGNEAFQYVFTLWEPAAINGRVWTVGGQDLLLWAPEAGSKDWPTGKLDVAYFGSRLTRVDPPVGGAFARLVYPAAMAQARAAGASLQGAEAWGWVPPPLVHEGAKVRPAWLHDYLLAPTPIRPASVLKMPRYNLSPTEAGKLVDYFAAVAGVGFPYSSRPDADLAKAGGVDRRRFDDAMKLLLAGKTDCAKCHLIGDYSPGGEIQTTLAPNLDRVGRRIRPEFLRRWLANPKSVLPYTAMTVNFPPAADPLEPNLFDGNTRRQLDAVRDLLINYDSYLRSRTAVQELVEPDPRSTRRDTK